MWPKGQKRIGVLGLARVPKDLEEGQRLSLYNRKKEEGKYRRVIERGRASKLSQ